MNVVAKTTSFAISCTDTHVLAPKPVKQLQELEACIMLLSRQMQSTRNVLWSISDPMNTCTNCLLLDQIRLIREAIDCFEVQTFTIDDEDGLDSSRIYGAFTSGIDLYLNMHWDKDFILCCTTIHMKNEYHISHKVVGYFAFPRYVIAIPIRPGDVLFFNPKEPHCVSSCCDNNDQIYCMSLYLKSDNIGKNDNKLPLNLSQEAPLLSDYRKNKCN